MIDYHTPKRISEYKHIKNGSPSNKLNQGFEMKIIIVFVVYEFRERYKFPSAHDNPEAKLMTGSHASLKELPSCKVVDCKNRLRLGTQIDDCPVVRPKTIK